MRNHIALCFAAAIFSSSAMAVDVVSKSSYEAEKTAAAHRYTEDKKLCAEETSSSLRMQCLRDARAEYDNALAKIKPEPASASVRGKTCIDCGKVLSVNVVDKAGEASPMGMVAGGVAGAVLGRQIGKGTGRDIATLAGAAGGAYAGRKIEQKMKSTRAWEVAVRFDNGDEKTFSFEQDPGFAVGAPVKAGNGTIVRR